MDHTETRPPLVDVSGAMRQTGVKRTTVYSLIDKGELVRVKIGARTLITQASIDSFVARLAAAARC
jgi:excisionase family DNA binding protein